ncbi:hypothetical protein DSUL_160073 [Desulfovibrionales bacterium]
MVLADKKIFSLFYDPLALPLPSRLYLKKIFIKTKKNLTDIL